MKKNVITAAFLTAMVVLTGCGVVFPSSQTAESLQNTEIAASDDSEGESSLSTGSDRSASADSSASTGSDHSTSADSSVSPENGISVSEDADSDTLPSFTEAELELLSEKSVCLDPGHFAGRNTLTLDDGTTYCEGDVTLEIGLALRDILEEYGVTVTMTRETGSITLGGYTDASLDGGHISLRGEAAAGCDLFVSLHTNANLDNANGYPTCEQPVEINKPIVIMNVLGAKSVTALTAGSVIGENLVFLYQKIGLGAEQAFETAEVGDDIPAWSDAYNDSLESAGAIVMRTEGGSDYYGVLSGSARVGVPGMIVEHGFHTVREFREQIYDGDLIGELAEADAAGILAGLLSED